MSKEKVEYKKGTDAKLIKLENQAPHLLMYGLL